MAKFKKALCEYNIDIETESHEKLQSCKRKLSDIIKDFDNQLNEPTFKKLKILDNKVDKWILQNEQTRQIYEQKLQKLEKKQRKKKTKKKLETLFYDEFNGQFINPFYWSHDQALEVECQKLLENYLEGEGYDLTSIFDEHVTADKIRDFVRLQQEHDSEEDVFGIEDEYNVHLGFIPCDYKKIPFITKYFSVCT